MGPTPFTKHETPWCLLTVYEILKGILGVLRITRTDRIMNHTKGGTGNGLNCSKNRKSTTHVVRSSS